MKSPVQHNIDVQEAALENKDLLNGLSDMVFDDFRQSETIASNNKLLTPEAVLTSNELDSDKDRDELMSKSLDKSMRNRALTTKKMATTTDHDF